MDKQIYLKLMPKMYLSTSSRNKRELSVAQEVGYTIKVISSDKASLSQEKSTSFSIISDEMTWLTAQTPRLKRYIIIISEHFRLMSILRQESKDILSCHDLLALLIGWVSTWFVKWGLKILAVHIDDGFDTEISKRNIARLAKLPNLTMKTVTPDAAQFNELTRAYVLAEVPNLATPQDNILFACIYKTAREHGIRSFLTGGNFALESILQKGNSHDAYDTVNIKAINRQFGREKIDKLPLISPFARDRYKLGMGIRTYRPLNYIDYNGQRAIDELSQGCGFEYYGSKHHENTLTKVIQTYWFYEKFHVDKRYSHLSSKIISGQMTREEALAELEKPVYDAEALQRDLAEVLPKLDLTAEQFDEIVHRPGKQHTAYRGSFYLKVRPYLLGRYKT